MNFKKIINKNVLIILISIISVALIFGALLFKGQKEYSDSYFYSMDTYVEIIADSDVKADIKQIFCDTEKIYNIHDAQSEVSKLNLSGGNKSSEKLIGAVKRIKELCNIYGNSADITVGRLTSLWNVTEENFTVPNDSDVKEALDSVNYENIEIKDNEIILKNDCQLDFGCVAKGIALDYVKQMLDEKNSGKAVVSAGSSSILLYGDDSFTTSILSPESEEIVGKISTLSGFVSTSGGYHRFAEKDGKKYMHIIDTKTGKPSETDLTSVTVYCQSGLDSDFLSTMILADGSENLSKYLNQTDFQIVAIDKNKKIYVSEGLSFELTDESFTYAEKN